MAQYSKQIQAFIDGKLTPELDRLTIELATLTSLGYNSNVINAISNRINSLTAIYNFMVEYVNGNEECDWSILEKLIEYTGLRSSFVAAGTSDYTLPLPTPVTLGGIYANRENENEPYKYHIRLKDDGFLETDATELEEDITVAGVTVGGLEDGDTINEGTTYTDLLKQMLVKRVPPTYVMPTANLSLDVANQQFETGSNITAHYTPHFTQNDAGPLSEVRFVAGTNIVHTQTDLSVFAIGLNATVPTTVELNVEIDYDEGPIKNDNLGDPDPVGRIPAGTKVSVDRIFYFNNYNWFGPGDPTDGTQVRSLDSSFNNTFTINTGSTEITMTVAVPDGKTISSIIDVDALNADLTANYILDGTITQVPDAGGNNKTYQVYKLSLATPYSSNHRHNVTIS